MWVFMGEPWGGGGDGDGGSILLSRGRKEDQVGARV
jgi:hypothetical protein